jgi:hypothetical protein
MENQSIDERQSSLTIIIFSWSSNCIENQYLSAEKIGTTFSISFHFAFTRVGIFNDYRLLGNSLVLRRHYLLVPLLLLCVNDVILTMARL